jgi:hypothetical protein
LIDTPLDGELKVFNNLCQQLQSITISTKTSELFIEEKGVFFLLFIDKLGNRKLTKVIIN